MQTFYTRKNCGGNETMMGKQIGGRRAGKDPHVGIKIRCQAQSGPEEETVSTDLQSEND